MEFMLEPTRISHYNYNQVAIHIFFSFSVTDSFVKSMVEEIPKV